MSTTFLAEQPAITSEPGNPLERARQWLERAFARQLAILDGQSGETLAAAPEEPEVEAALSLELCRAVARQGHAEFVAEEDPLITLAIPLEQRDGARLVAVGTFLTRAVDGPESLDRAARALGLCPEATAAWAVEQAPMPPEALLRLAESVVVQSRTALRIAELEDETAKLSDHLASTYEEISLLYRLTQNLRISASDEELGRVALEWLGEVVPARALAIELLPTGTDDESFEHEARNEPLLLTGGQFPVEAEEFRRLVGHLKPEAANRPVVVNLPITRQDDWPCPQVRQVIAVPLAEGENLFGWLAALNHIDDEEFGTGEASLLASVAAILGIHSGNIELYRQQSELLAGVVRALTSAIDAKDPYTCGHSDRVARVAVRLAEEIGCDAEVLRTIYLSGLLHDIGKIGINDAVLRKPGKLSNEEYEHIKRHVEIGHKILRDLGRLDDVLPVILHHHESWDGGGYPHKLDGQRIPLCARIVAVADAFDAMGSDRPYRKGMPDEKIDNIFRSGAGQQWDPEVIGAFFRARDDVRRIANSDQDAVVVNLQHCR